MKTLASEWESFRTAVLVPANAPPVQVMECRRAFYAGAAAFFSNTLDFSDANVPDDQGVQALEVMSQELQAFGRDIASGKA